WCRLQTRLLDGLNRLDLILKAVQTAPIRSQVAQARPTTITPILPTAVGSGGLIGAISAVQQRQQQQVNTLRVQSLQLDVARLATLTWQGARVEAARVVSLGDLIDGDHGTAAATRNAAAFFDRFSPVTACLHAGFSEVLPSIRLD